LPPHNQKIVNNHIIVLKLFILVAVALWYPKESESTTIKRAKLHTIASTAIEITNVAKVTLLMLMSFHLFMCYS